MTAVYLCPFPFFVFLQNFGVGILVVVAAALDIVFPLWNKRRWEQCEGQKCEVCDSSVRPLFFFNYLLLSEGNERGERCEVFTFELFSRGDR